MKSWIKARGAGLRKSRRVDVDPHNQRVALLKISLALFALILWSGLSSVLSTRPPQSKAALEAAPTKLARLARFPASLPIAREEPLSDPVRMDLIKINCWDQNSREIRTEGSRWIRLLGKACKRAPGSEHISVTNLSNGYAATIFDLAAGGLTTDFIPLTQGANALVIHFEYADGRKPLDTRFTLTR